MDYIVLSATLILAMVFLLSGSSKLIDRTGTAITLREFGIPPRYSGSVAGILPIAELATSALLVLPSTRMYGTVVALGLLLLFTTAIAHALSRGKSTNCRCFGQIRSRPIGWHTLGRNAGLIVVASGPLVLNADGIDPHSSTAVQVLAAGLTTAGLLAAVGFEFADLYGQGRTPGVASGHAGTYPAVMGRASEPSDEGSLDSGEVGSEQMRIGDVAPHFSLPATGGGQVSLADLTREGVPVVLIFIDPECELCESVLESIEETEQSASSDVIVQVIGCGSVDEHRLKGERFGIGEILVQEDWEVADALGSESVPSAVLIQPGGIVGSAIAEGPDEVLELIRGTGRTSEIPKSA